MSKENGGSAFPLAATEWHTGAPGMTLRDYAAIKAMQSIMNNEAELQRIRSHYYEKNQLPAIAAMSYRMADAMIEARKNG